jgi:pimeloyl-ACP methyl ester carboxylesterase
MGSVLRLGGEEVWSKDPKRSYRTLVDNPSLLRYTPGATVEVPQVLDAFRKYGVNWLPLYTSLIETLQGRFSPSQLLLFAYDWRQDVRVSVRQLRERVVQQFRLQHDASGRAMRHPEYAFDVLGHSQGGLIAFLAVARGVIHPDNIRSVTLLGAPIGGAPRAFRSLFHDVDLPGLDTAIWWWWGKDRALAAEHLLKVVRTFPSLYQQMPPSSERYVFDERSRQLINPLDEQVIEAHHVKVARELHAEVADAVAHSPAFGARLRIIHVDNLPTDVHYYATSDAAGYRFTWPPDLRANGDETVTQLSALYRHQLERLGQADPQLSIQHHKLCEDPKIIQLIQTILS